MAEWSGVSIPAVLKWIIAQEHWPELVPDKVTVAELDKGSSSSKKSANSRSGRLTYRDPRPGGMIWLLPDACRATLTTGKEKLIIRITGKHTESRSCQQSMPSLNRKLLPSSRIAEASDIGGAETSDER